VSKASAARRLVTAAAYGGGGLGVLGGALYGLVRVEAMLARRTIGPAKDAPPPVADGVYGAYLPGEAVSLLLLGDSAAAGYGMTDALDTPGALMGQGLAGIVGRPVRITCRAFVGARTASLDRQITDGLRSAPVLAVIIIGANDVTHSVRPSEAVRLLARAVRRLHTNGCEVVVGTCPDLGTIGPIAPPLRQLARVWSHRMAAAQTITTVEAGGRSVSLGQLLGQEFAAAPHELFGADRFHPSRAGYARMVAALLPSVADALGVRTVDDEWLDSMAGERVLPVSFAAAQAADVAGTEVTAASVAGSDRGPRGRWAQIRRRRRAEVPQPSAPTADIPR